MVVVNSNFEFLKLDYDLSEFFRTANLAEVSYTLENYEDVLVKGRIIAESTARLLVDQLYIEGISERTRLVDLNRTLQPYLENDRIYRILEFLRFKGNDAAHNINPEDATEKNALKALKALYELLAWYMKTYSFEEMEEAGMKFMIPQAQERYQTAARKFIYIQEADTSAGGLDLYEGKLKVGEGTAPDADVEEDFSPNSDYLRKEAPKRIKQYMTTSGLNFKLGWVELAYRKKDKQWFGDAEVHQVLKRSGIKRAEQLSGQEWFETDLETAKKAIWAVKEGHDALQSNVSEETTQIVLRPEQRAAVDQTAKVFKKKNRMLWNAKMRFGKTLTALELVKQEGFQKVLIMTHRPVVKDSWFEDFKKMNLGQEGYVYGSDTQGESLEKLKTGNRPFVFFASIQKLRYGQGEVNLGEFAEVDWDFVIIDEAHEGTQTELSAKVLDTLVGKDTKLLELSGTPFNILHDFEEDQVYTWDYTMEQEAKLKWDLANPDEANPYEKLPKVNMFTFEMKQKGFMDESKSFNFREFFKPDDNGHLVYKDQVKNFLDNITNYDDSTQYPFSTKAFREELRHTLWLLPGVREANALENLLKEHPVFGQEYNIVNVVRGATADNGIASQGDLDKVRQAIGKDPSKTKTITLTVRKLTTGVNVPEWTGVVFLSNTNSPMNYLQAAFRAQTPFSHENLGMKTDCYVFDFAPDRALTVMAESAQINSGVGKKNTQEQKQAMAKLLNFLPILGHTGNGMVSYDVDKMLVQLKKVYAEKAVRSGFEDDSLYNDQLLTLTSEDASKFDTIKGIVGTTKKERNTKVMVNDNGLTDEEYEKGEKAKKKKPRERTDEEKKILEKIKEAKNQRKTMISILRGVSIRIPMMIYGMSVDLDTDITIKDFIRLVDEQSWKEFMPKGFTKGLFKDIVKYYDPEVFIEAGRIIRQRAKSYDKLDFIERAERIADLFSTFKNPDKETVLTPWRVVNLQITKTLGGVNFFDKDYQYTTKQGTSALQWIEQEDTAQVYGPDVKILDINAKTGLYPLHAAMSLYYKALMENQDNRFEADRVYENILANNIYAIAKTPMAKTITQRTLAGYRDLKTNIQYIENFETSLKTSPEAGKERIEEVFDHVKFDVVIGNPPYQEETIGDNSTFSPPIYHRFMELAYEISDKVSLITPARFLFNAGSTPKSWNKRMLSDEHLKIVCFEQNSERIFPNTDIKGGVVVTYRDIRQNFGAVGTFTPFEELNSILKKVEKKTIETLDIIISGRGVYKLADKALQDYPEIESIQSKGHKYDVGSGAFRILSDILYFKDKQSDEDVAILGLENATRVYKWIKRDYLNPPSSFFEYKVFFPQANGTGAIGEVLSTPLIGAPLIGATETFLSLGGFKSKSEAESALKFIKTKFARALLGVLKITQATTRDKWSKVPLEDFTITSDIDWSKSISEIDQQLFEKYGLSEKEIRFIEEKVSVME